MSDDNAHDGRSRRRRPRRGQRRSRSGGGGGGGGGQRSQGRRSRANLDELIARMSDYTPIQPIDRIKIETRSSEPIGRIVDMMTPIGRGQRGLITSPPKAGKTTILQTIARAVAENHPEIVQIALLVDERPEEATDFRRNVPVKVVASTSDQPAKQHVKAAESVFKEAIAALLEGKDVLVLLDSITRLARAYNMLAGSGKILSGGVTAGALDRPRQLFGAARKLEDAGSLTVIATALVETGSVMDEVIFQEFKGTGNLELILDRQLSQRRLFPAVDIGPSGTRREMDLLRGSERQKIPALRRMLADKGKEEGLNWLLKRIKKTDSNAELLDSVLS